MSCKKIILCSALAGVVVSISLFTVNLAYERFFEPNLTFGIYYSKAMILAWPSSLMFMALAGRETTFFAYQILALAVVLNALLYSMPGVLYGICKNLIAARKQRIHIATKFALFGIMVAISLFTFRSFFSDFLLKNQIAASCFNIASTTFWPLSKYTLQFGSPADIVGRPLSVDLAIPIYATVYLFGTNMVLYGLLGYVFATIRKRFFFPT